MNEKLPNYFLADLPPEAVVTGTLITEACQTLQRNRERYLASRSTREIFRVLDSVGRSWLEPDYPFRQTVLELGPAATGFSKKTLANGLDQFFSQLTAENLEAFLTQELGHADRLDRFCRTGATKSRTIAHGPGLVGHIAPGNIPNPVLMSIILGLLVRSAQFVKCASGQALIPRMFAHSLYEAEPKLGACMEIAEWKGGSDELESALFAECDCVTVTGSDETLDSVRRRVPAHVRFLGYGTRVSFGYITRESFAQHSPKTVATLAARDISAWNQLGCLSPHVFYVEKKAKVAPELFAQMLAEQLEHLETIEPRGQITVRESANIATRRSFYEVRAAHSVETQMWASKGSTAWTVIFEEDPAFQVSCLNRFAYVKAVNDIEEALHGAGLIRSKTSTVGLAATEAQMHQLSMRLAKWGACRVCPLGQMQNPPLGWHHDGRPALADLVKWTDWEEQS